MKNKKFELKGNKVTINPVDINNLWEGDWEIHIKDGEKEKIGTVSFAGEKLLGAIPLKIEIPDIHYRNQGYGTEAIGIMREWAFYHRNIFEIKAEIAHDNSAAIMAFQKAGFVFRDGTREIEHYSVLKQKTTWLGLYFCIGIVIGLILAAATGLTWGSLIASITVCVVAGAGMDARENAYMRQVTGTSVNSYKRKNFGKKKQ